MEHLSGVFIVDIKNGFEDVEWGFTYSLPELKKTGYKYPIKNAFSCTYRGKVFISESIYLR